MRQAGLPPELIGNLLARCRLARRRPGEAVRRLVALDALMCRDPPDWDAASPGEQTVAHLRRGNGEPLAGAGLIGPDTVHCGDGVDENRMAASALSSLIQRPSAWDTVGVEHLLVRAEVETAPLPAVRASLCNRCSHLPALQPRAIGPHRVPLPGGPCRLRSSGPVLDYDLAWEGALGTPLLRLHRLAG